MVLVYLINWLQPALTHTMAVSPAPVAADGLAGHTPDPTAPTRA